LKIKNPANVNNPIIATHENTKIIKLKIIATNLQPIWNIKDDMFQIK